MTKTLKLSGHQKDATIAAAEAYLGIAAGDQVKLAGLLTHGIIPVLPFKSSESEIDNAVYSAVAQFKQLLSEAWLLKGLPTESECDDREVVHRRHTQLMNDSVFHHIFEIGALLTTQPSNHLILNDEGIKALQVALNTYIGLATGNRGVIQEMIERHSEETENPTNFIQFDDLLKRAWQAIGYDDNQHLRLDHPSLHSSIHHAKSVSLMLDERFNPEDGYYVGPSP